MTLKNGAIPFALLTVDDPNFMFGQCQLAPRTVVEYFDQGFDNLGCTKTNVYKDPNAHALSAQPTPIMADTVLSAWTTAYSSSQSGSSPWSQITDHETNQLALLMDDPSSATYSATAVSSLNPAKESNGYYVRIIKGIPPTAGPRSQGSLHFNWYLGTNYRVNACYGQPFKLQQFVSSAWHDLIIGQNILDCEHYLKAHDRTVVITVLFYPSRNAVSIYIGGDDEDLSFSLAGVPGSGTFSYSAPPTGNYKIEGAYGKLTFQKFSVGYPLAYSYKSGLQTVGYVPSQLPKLSLFPRPDATNATFNPATTLNWTYASGSTVAMTYAMDPIITDSLRYTINGTNPDAGSGYSLSTPVLQYAIVDFPAVTRTTNTSIAVTIAPQEVNVQFSFDWNTYLASGVAHLRLNNYNSQNTGFSGMRAAKLELGLKFPDGTLFTQTVMYGWFGAKNTYGRQDPHRWSTHVMYDRTYTLRKSCGIMPWLDGWSINDAIRFLYQSGGVLSDAGVYDWLVNVPGCMNGPLPQGCPYPLLPIGTGISPRWRPNKEGSIISEVLRICSNYRMMTGFDTNSNVVFTPYSPTAGPIYTGSIGVTGGSEFTFGGAAQWDGSGWPMFNEFVDAPATIDRSVEDVRSAVNLYGVDPADGSVLVARDATYHDNIVYNPSYPGFLGYENDLNAVDNMYVSLPDMATFAASMAQQAAIPTVNTGFTVWPHFGLFIGSRFNVFDDNILADVMGNTAEFRATGINHHLMVDGESGTFRGRTMVEAKSVANI